LERLTGAGPYIVDPSYIFYHLWFPFLKAESSVTVVAHAEKRSYFKQKLSFQRRGICSGSSLTYFATYINIIFAAFDNSGKEGEAK
jgi:hypothetical protein